MITIMTLLTCLLMGQEGGPRACAPRWVTKHWCYNGKVIKLGGEYEFMSDFFFSFFSLSVDLSLETGSLHRPGCPGLAL